MCVIYSETVLYMCIYDYMCCIRERYCIYISISQSMFGVHRGCIELPVKWYCKCICVVYICILIYVLYICVCGGACLGLIGVASRCQLAPAASMKALFT